jgi:hypothetical protein
MKTAPAADRIIQAANSPGAVAGDIADDSRNVRCEIDRKTLND